MKGKYTWPPLPLIWLITMLCMVAYRDSWLIDQLLAVTLL